MFFSFNKPKDMDNLFRLYILVNVNVIHKSSEFFKFTFKRFYENVKMTLT